MIRVEWNNFLCFPRKGWAIDIGCRGFVLPKILSARGMKIIAIDPAPDIVKPDDPNIFYERIAVVGAVQHNAVNFNVIGDGLTSRVCDAASNRGVKSEKGEKSLGQAQTIEVPVKTLEDLLSEYGIDRVEILKLNCEGAEEQILLGLKRPLARQISVEFHRHLGFRGFTPEIRKHMSQWYYWVSSVENFPFERVVFCRKKDRKLRIFLILAVIRNIPLLFVYLCKKLYRH